MELPVRLYVSPLHWWPPKGHILFGTGIRWNWMCECGHYNEIYDIPTRLDLPIHHLPGEMRCEGCGNQYRTGANPWAEGKLYRRINKF